MFALRHDHQEVPVYRLYDTAGRPLGLFEDPATSIGPGDILVLEDGRDAHVTGRVEMDDEEVWAVLVVFVGPTSPTIPLDSEGGPFSL